MHTHRESCKQTDLALQFHMVADTAARLFLQQLSNVLSEESSSKQVRLPLLNCWKKPQHEHIMGGKGLGFP